MPQLPSGRHIAFGYDSLQKLVADVSRGHHIDDLLDICDIEILGNFIDVIYFHETTSSEPLSEEKQLHPKGLVPYNSGFTFSSIKSEIENWDVADSKAYFDFINSSQMQQWIKELLSIVEDEKRKLFYLCDNCLSEYRNLVYDSSSNVELNYTPLTCIVWLDEHPGGVPVSSEHIDCRNSIIRLSNARKSLWREGNVPPILTPTWKAAQKIIPNWPGFKRLSISEDLVLEIDNCETGWKYMVSQFEEFNRSNKLNRH